MFKERARQSLEITVGQCYRLIGVSEEFLYVGISCMIVCQTQ